MLSPRVDAPPIVIPPARFHQIFCTTDVARLMAFAQSGDDTPAPTRLRREKRERQAAGQLRESGQSGRRPCTIDARTGEDVWAEALLGKPAQAMLTDVPGHGPVLAVTTGGCKADPFLGRRGRRYNCRLEAIPASLAHLQLIFEDSQDDFWLPEDAEVVLVTPSSSTGGLTACPMTVEFGKLGADKRLRYVFRCGKREIPVPEVSAA